MGYMKTFLPAEIFAINPFTCSAMGRASLKKGCDAASPDAQGVLEKSRAAEFMQ
jgi:multisubunit Na+/H+ antiporter MnhG subunit